jgi:hypothetical protein
LDTGADRRRRYPEAARGLAEAAGFDDVQENGNAVQAVDGSSRLSTSTLKVIEPPGLYTAAQVFIKVRWAGGARPILD